MSSHGHSVHHSLFPQRILKPCDEVGERLRTVCSIKKCGLTWAIHTGLRDLNTNGDDLRLQANALQAQTQHLEHPIGATARGSQAHGQNELTRFKPKPYPKAHYGFSAMLQRAREVAQQTMEYKHHRIDAVYWIWKIEGEYTLCRIGWQRRYRIIGPLLPTRQRINRQDPGTKAAGQGRQRQ
jgi:hypothetical protein